MKRGSCKRTSSVKGQTGNPGGRPKKPATIEARKIIKDIKEAARELTPEALQTLKDTMSSAGLRSRPGFLRATAILDRCWGKPKESVDHTVRGPTLEELVLTSYKREEAEAAGESETDKVH